MWLNNEQVVQFLIDIVLVIPVYAASSHGDLLEVAVS